MKRSNVFVGRELYSCGACSIESILSYYGGYVPHETVLIDTFTTKTGTNAYNIIKALEKYGFNAYGLRIKLDDITKYQLPIIAHTTIDNYNHFLVIYEIRKNKIITMDPKWGAKTYSLEQFKSIFNEVVIIVKPVRKIAYMQPKNTLKSTIKKNIRTNRKKILILLVISTITIFLGFLISAFIRIVDITHIYRYTLGFIIICVIKWLLNYIKILSEEKLANEFKINFIKKIVYHIFHIERMYIANKRVGEIICKITDSSYIIDFFTKLIFSGIIDFLALILGLIIMFIISIKTSLINLLGGVFYLFITLSTARKLYRKEMECVDYYNVYNGDLTEYIDGIETIKNLGTEETYIAQIEKSYKNYIDSSYNAYKFNSLINLFKNSIMEINFIISIAIYLLTINSQIDLYNIIIYTSIYSIFSSSLTNIVSYIPGFMHIKAIYRNVSDFIDLNYEKDGNKLLKDINVININKLKYSYDKNKTIIALDNITIKKNDKILLIGSSGMGKSTLVKCISGYLNDYEGTITIDNVDIKDLSMLTIKKNILYVGQEERLFTDTVKNNIVGTYYDEIKFKKIIELCELSNVIDSKSEKENNLILEGGINYSKGEKARIILARSLYKEPKVLIIDELLSSIPESQENRILKRLLDLSDTTLIYITHRNKKEYFDKIIELERK